VSPARPTDSFPSPSLPTVTDVDEEEGLRAADGRMPGRRGRATRQKLLEQTAEMVHSTPFRDLKVVDIARQAGTSPATFYQYFPDVEAAILVLAEEMAQQIPELGAMAKERSWKGRAGYDTAAALVEAFMEFWETHRAVLRVVDLATAEGDDRFRKIRSQLLNPLTRALADAIERQQATSKHPDDLDPMASAGVLVAMLAHVASHRYGFEFWGIRTPDTTRSMARIVHTTVTGQKPPADS